jgi:hypothetical protein
MKKVLIFLILILVSCNFNQDKNSTIENSVSYHLTANIENLKDSLSIILTRLDKRNLFDVSVDSTLSHNGSFEFKGDISEPSEYVINIIDYKAKVGKRIVLWLENGDLSISGNFDKIENAKIMGSKLTDLSENYNAISEKYGDLMKNGKIDYKDYKKGMLYEHMNFLYQNPNNAVSLTKFIDFIHYITNDSLKLYYSKLDSRLKNSINGVVLKNSFDIEQLKV